MKHYIAQRQQGFTLIELMVAIVLGLLITAAAVQLFMTGMISLNMQRAMADIQDNGNFGLSYLTKDLRMANYQAAKPIADNATEYGGIVLSSDNFPKVAGTAILTNTALFTKTAVEGSTKKTDTASDQLTIQYKPSQSIFPDSLFAQYMSDSLTLTAAQQAQVVGTDCEGANITLNDVKEGVYLVQRYYVDAGAFKCDAARYFINKKDAANVVQAPAITGLESNAQTIMQNVEYMRILLAVSENNADSGTGNQSNLPVDGLAQKNLRYIDTYPAGSRVRGIQVGFLVRGSSTVNGGSILESQNNAKFRVLDKDVELVSKDKVYLRQVITQTVALRNAMGAES